MNEQLILVREQFRWGLANLTQASLNLDNEDIDYLIQQAERVEELEENCSHLRKSFQRQRSKAIEGWEKVIELEKENYQARTRFHQFATIVIDQEQEYKDLQEEKRLVEEECERYKKMFSKEKGKNIELEVKIRSLRLQIGREIT